MSDEAYDLVVIGAGPGGYVAAIRAAQLGLNVAVVERTHMGGICLNWGCIPTKAMLRSAELFQQMKTAKEFGLTIDKIGYDLPAIIDRSRGIAEKLRQGVEFLMKKNKIRTFFGDGRLIGQKSVKISGKEGETIVTSENILLATGARARQLPGLEADGEFVWTYKDALQPKRMPTKLLVIGSGAIGIEFASFYNTLGAETTVIETMDQILPLEDHEISTFASKQFLKQGMKIFLNSSVKNLDRTKNGVRAQIEKSGKNLFQNFDTVISAVGIVGNVENLGLEEIGIEISKSHVVTDEFCRTSVAGIYAIGDVAGAPWLAHKASHEGIMVAELVAGHNSSPVRPENIAACTYCNPQIASIGVTEAKAKKEGFDVKIGRFPFAGNGKALALGETEGFIKTIFDAKTGELLGAHMVGTDVTELIQGYVIGRKLETTEQELIETIFPHPTLSEMMHESALDAFERAVHV